MKSAGYYINYVRAHYLKHATAAHKIGDFKLARELANVKRCAALEKQIKLVLALNQFKARRAMLTSENIFMKFARDIYVNRQMKKIQTAHNQTYKYDNLLKSAIRSSIALYESNARQNNQQLIYQTMNGLTKSLYEENFEDLSLSDRLFEVDRLLNELPRINTSSINFIDLPKVLNHLTDMRHNIMQAREHINNVLECTKNSTDHLAVVQHSIAINMKVVIDDYLSKNDSDLRRVLLDFNDVSSCIDHQLTAELDSLRILRTILVDLHRRYNLQELNPSQILPDANIWSNRSDMMLTQVENLQDFLVNRDFDPSACRNNEMQNLTFILNLLQTQMHNVTQHNVNLDRELEKNSA